jgi:hypothetical protein
MCLNLNFFQGMVIEMLVNNKIQIIIIYLNLNFFLITYIIGYIIARNL